MATCSTRSTRPSRSISPARRSRDRRWHQARHDHRRRLQPELTIDDVTVIGRRFAAASTRTSPSPGPGQRLAQVTVHYATANGSAIAPAGLHRHERLAHLCPRPDDKTVSVPVNGDALDEIDETFSLNLAVPANATILRQAGLGTITDDDGLPSLSIDDVTVTEGRWNGERDLHRHPFLRQRPDRDRRLTQPPTAPHRRSRLRGDERQPHLRPEPDDSRITVPTSGDLLDEIDETFTLGLSNAGQRGHLRPLGLGTITDDDAQRPRSRSTT